LPGADNRFARRFIKLVDQHPRASIGHAKMTSGLTNRSLGPNSFQQRDLAGAYAVTVGKVDTNAGVELVPAFDRTSGHGVHPFHKGTLRIAQRHRFG
jgi:hypothetical protein